MTLMLPALLMLLLGGIEAQLPVHPLLTCWFPSYLPNGTRLFNLVLGYNNTDPADQVLPIVLGENTLSPYSVDGQQPELYKAGVQTYGFVLTVPGNITAVSWLLENSTLQIDTSLLQAATRCDQALAGVCPTWIDGFCEDGSFCNGHETCFSSSFTTSSTQHIMGACVAPSQGVQCPGPQVCQETPLARCLETAAPTTAPTEGPTQGPTPAPTDAPTLVPTSGPTRAPTRRPTRSPTAPPSVDIDVRVNCWYSTRNNPVDSAQKPIVHVVMDYINPAMVPIARPVTQILSGVANMLTPAYNGQQPALFLPGTQNHAFTLVDQERLLEKGTAVTWHLGRLRHVIEPVRNLTRFNRCLRTPALTVQCSTEQSDCSAYDSFCSGPARCDVQAGHCVYQSVEYTACPERLEGSVIGMQCIEEQHLCAQTVDCESDSQCTDDLLCNGQEACVDGECVSQEDYSCGDEESFECVEGVGCVALQNYPISNGAIVGIVIGAAVVVLLFVGIILCYLYYSKRESNHKRSRREKRK